MKKVSLGIKQNFNKMAVMLIPIAIAINFVAGSLALILRLPIYLDMIGTFLISMLGGPWIGALTGVLSITLNSTSDPSLLPYAFVAGVLGWSVGVLANLEMFETVKKQLIAIFIVVVLAVVTSVLVTVVVYGGFGTGGSSIITAALLSVGVPHWAALFTSSIISEIPDKLISLYFPLLVIHSMSHRYLVKFPNGRKFMSSL